MCSDSQEKILNLCFVLFFGTFFILSDKVFQLCVYFEVQKMEKEVLFFVSGSGFTF